MLGMWLALAPAAALGQRVIFPTPVPDNSASGGTQAASPAYGVDLQSVPGSGASPYLPPGGFGPPPPTTAPAAAQLPTGPVSPYVAPPPGYGSPPTSFAPPPGTIQPTQQPAWDPYAPPGTTPLAQAPAYEPGPVAPPGGFFPQAIRLLQEVQVQDTWVPRQIGNNGFGIDDIIMNASFGFPVGSIAAPLIITPGFNIHLLDGPVSIPGQANDLPGHVYDAYLGASWRPQFSPMWGADLAVSAGAYSDFQQVTWNSVRVLGRGLGVVTLSPQWKVEAGIVYLDRLSVKLLPAGGVIWTPNPDVKFDFVFPYPKFAERISNVGNFEVWAYLRGEYGGSQWSVVHTNGVEDVINYNDLRAILGLEWFGNSRIRGNVELGFVFDRNIMYRYTAPTAHPGDTMMFQANFAF